MAANFNFKPIFYDALLRKFTLKFYELFKVFFQKPTCFLVKKSQLNCYNYAFLKR